jgi:heat shock protein HtpX
MDLWSEPMTANVAAFLLAALATLFILIFWEIRSHARTENPRPPKPEVVRPPRPQVMAPGAASRIALLLARILAPLALLGFLFGPVGPAAALGLMVATALWSFWYTGPAILAQCGARRVTDPNLVEAVAELAAKAGIPAPRILEIQETHPNAFALGAGSGHASIIVTLGLRSRLTLDEQRAVIGHEISHIAHHDTLRATLGVTLMGAIATLAVWLGLIGLSVRRQGAAALLFLAILAPVSALVRRLAGAQSREYQADREGALLCGNPADLISALSKLDASARRFASITANDQPALAALFIVNPLPNSWVGRLFTAPPPIAKRIARLSAFSSSVASGLPPETAMMHES